MPFVANGTSNTLRILVSTDNHVGYNERDAIRGDDSWRTFDEIMSLARERDVDFVLLGGDLFHDNVPSRKSLYEVMRSLRVNCLGDKPCEFQLLSDSSQHFDKHIGHANHEDENINVGIPVYSIHGNHDDPSGFEHYAALDILEMSGLVNYFGRVPDMDKITVRPLLFQKGTTKLALYGLSNVRDERMYRTFRDKKVTWESPSDDDWYNIGIVHQNHHAHGATSYLPENFLPEMLDLVIWGHEHECKIEPSVNMEMNFKVMQPGSSIATSLAIGEAVQKQVAILEVNNGRLKVDPIPLKTVRPFVYKEIVLAREKEAVKIYTKNNYKPLLTEWLTHRVNKMIEEANQQWRDAQEADPNFDSTAEPEVPPLPLIRLRVDISGALDKEGKIGNKFEVDNPQRFSGRFTDRVANPTDLVQFHAKKRIATTSRIKLAQKVNEMVAQGGGNPDAVDISTLVQSYLASQSLTILPQNSFGDAVGQYVDKDDKHAMDLFINDSLSKQIRHLAEMNADEDEEDEAENMLSQFDKYKAEMEKLFASGQLKNRRGGTLRYREKPKGWDDERDGAWEDDPAAMIIEEQPQEESSEEGTPQPATRGRGRGRGATGGRSGTRGRGGTAAKKTPAREPARGKKKQTLDTDEEDSASPKVIALDSDDDDVVSIDSNSQAMFFPDKKNGKRAGSTAGSGRSPSVVGDAPSRKAVSASRKPPTRAAAKPAKQSQLNFSTSQASVFGGKSQKVLDDIEDDDDDAFEPVVTTATKRKR